MAIDVVAVSSAWRMMGGEARWRPDKGAMVLRAGREIAAFVRPNRMRVYWPDAGECGANVYDGSCLPEIAQAWGLTPAEPEVLTWERAAALWVEWGGVSLPSSDDIFASLVRVDRRDDSDRPLIFQSSDGGPAVWCCADSSDKSGIITLTRDTLEDMAEACGLPRTPGYLVLSIGDRCWD